MTRAVLTWVALWLLIATSTAAGIVAGGLILGTLSPAAAASRPGLASPSPSGELTSPSLPGRTEAPTDPAISSVGRAGAADPVGRPTVGLSAGSTPVRGANVGAPIVPTLPSAGLAGSPSPAVVAVPAATAGPTIAGAATWYCLPGRSACTRGYPAGGMYAAAGPALRVGDWRGRVVQVCGKASCIEVTLIDWCLCRDGRVVDLYAGAFAQLAPLSRGVIAVEVAWP